MEINYGSRQMQRLCSDEQAMRAAWGDDIARTLMLRLTAMEAADSLDDLCKLPQVCCEAHPAARDRLSLGLGGPYRLVFEADHDPLPTGHNGGLEWGRVQRVRVLEVSPLPVVDRNKGDADFEKALRT
jgi:proteic killer suppression protein